MRELIGVTENTGQAWAQSTIDLLVAMKRTKENRISRGFNEATAYYLDKYSRMFIEALMYKFMEAEQHDWIYKRKRSGGALRHHNKASAEALR